MSSPMTRKYFDDRFQTDIEALLKRPRTLHSSVEDVDVHPSLQWHELVPEINSPDFLTRYGQVCIIEPSTLFIAVGTDRGFVAVFNYHQKLTNVLSPSESSSSDDEVRYVEDKTISALNVSQDLAVVAAGYVSGRITLWQLDTKPEIVPYHTIYPITLEQRFNQNKDGHLSIPITNIRMSHDNKHVLTSDVSGLMFFHYEVKNLLTRSFMTVKAVGKNDANAVPDERTKIYDFDLLPVGNTSQITDQVGLVAVITGRVLSVISVFSLDTVHNLNLKPHFSCHRPKSITMDEDSTACADWFPCIDDNGVQNARLAFCWNECLTVLELNNRSLPSNLVDVINDLKDKDKSIPTLPISKTGRLFMDEKIHSVKWVSSSTVCCFTETKIIMLLYQPGTSAPLEVIGSESLIHRVPRLMLKLKSQVVNKTYNTSIKLVKGRMVVMNSLHGMQVMIGKPISWNDKLVELLSQANYEQALKLCYFYYSSNKLGSLVMFGLPEDAAKRKRLVQPYLVKILNSAVVHYQNCELYLKIINDLGHFELLDLIYENSSDSDFFDHLLDYLLSGKVMSLSPMVLKNLVLYYQHDGMLLTEILCTIDITMLDIDSTIQICEKNKLDECLIFIYNYLLHDYKSPFYRLLEKNDDRIYTYVSYILTGKQYPTDKFIVEESDAKKQLIDILFDHTSDVSFVEESSIFPVLTTLLKKNSFEMLSTLNEFFEDSIMNEETTTSLTRQYILEALLDIYASSEFTKADKCNLAIFIGRNYTKYSQFLRLSDSTLSQVMDNLISYSDENVKADCELAIQSLLVQFEPYDEKEFIQKLTYKKFYMVLTSLYQKQNKHYKVLQMWLNGSQEAGFVNILADCFKSTKVGVNRLNLISLVKQHFEVFVQDDLDKFVNLINTHEPSLHKQILSCKDDAKFSYLQQLFSIGNDEPELIAEYVKLMVLRNVEADEFLRAKLQYLDDNSLQDLKKFLEAHKQVNEVAIILVKEDKIDEALTQLLQYFTTDMDPKSFELFVDILETHDMADYWIKLIDKLVVLSSEAPQLNDYIYKTFRALSKHETKFPQIFNTFLSNNDQTTLMNIRNILIDILISYSYESEILKISAHVLDENIYEKLNLVKADNLAGWNITCKNCVNCNKPLYGDKIDPQNFVIWENLQMERLQMKQLTEDEKNDGDSLVFFKCMHGYHSRCLKNLSSQTCVVCIQ